MGTLKLRKLTFADLLIYHLEDLEHLEDVEKAKLRDRAELRGLTLVWHTIIILTEIVRFKNTDAVTTKLSDRLVLEKLMPPRTLEDLVLMGYMSNDFPNWMFDISSYLHYLSSIALVGLTACDSLAPFGKLPNLRILFMCLMPNIRKIGREFYREQGACKRLSVLELYSLENLDEWWTTRSAEEEEEFLIPNLHLLKVSCCPKLKFHLYPPKSMHWNLYNSNEVLPVHGFGQLSSPTPLYAKIASDKFVDLWVALQHLCPTLETLDLSATSSLRTFPEVASCLSSLRFLPLSLEDLEILPEWLGQLNSLEELKIYQCSNLTSLLDSIRNLTALKTLWIEGCPKLSERCQDEDSHKISHVSFVRLD